MLSTCKLFSFHFDACRSEETSSVREAGSLNLLSIWIYCPLCTCKSVVKELWSQLPKSNEVGLQKLPPAPFPPLPAQHLPLGSSLTFKGNVSHCNLRVNASGSNAFVFLLSVLPCTWEGPRSSLSYHNTSHLYFWSSFLLVQQEHHHVSGYVFWMEGNTCLSLVQLG